MAQTYKTEGIILKRWDHKERDRMVRIFTKDHGKITTRAISVRKHGAKLTGHIEPFIHAHFFIAKSKTIDILAGSLVIQAHREVRQSPLHVSTASFFAEILDVMTEERDADDALFAHAQDFYQWLNTHTPHTLALYAAVLQIYAIVGYRMELYSCHQCKQPITTAGAKFHYQLWNVECASCASTHATVAISLETIKVLRFLQHEPFAAAVSLHLAQKEWRDVHEFFFSLLHYHLDRPLQSESVFFQIAQEAA